MDLVKFNVSDKVIGELKEKFTKVPDCSKKEGYEFVRVGIGELVKKRTGLAEHKTKLKAPHLAYNRKVDAEYNRLVGELEALETPMKAAKAEEDKKKEVVKELKRRAEEERKFQINEKINEIREVAFKAISAPVDKIRAMINEINDMKLTKVEYGEFKNAGEMARIDTKIKLESILERVMKEEAAEVSRKEEEAKLAEDRKALELETAAANKEIEERRLADEAQLAIETKALGDKRIADEAELEKEKETLRIRQKALDDENEKQELAKTAAKQEKEKKERDAKSKNLQTKMKNEAIKAMVDHVDCDEEGARFVVDAIIAGRVPHVKFGG